MKWVTGVIHVFLLLLFFEALNIDFFCLFFRITYTEAIDILNSSNQKFIFPTTVCAVFLFKIS